MKPSHSAEPDPGRVTPLGDGDPARIGSYSLEGVVGRGGMGVVFVGRRDVRDPVTGDAATSDRDRTDLVAVKVVRPELTDSPAHLARFRQETAVARRVDHPRAARVLDAGDDDGRPWLVTEYVAGPTLADEVSAHGPLAAAPLQAVALGLADAVQAFDAAGVVHRDVKPSNVVLTADGPTVVDFGVARAVDVTSVTVAGDVVGSPSWMAPEQLLGNDVTAAVDVHAWGMTVAYAATGRCVHDGPTPEARMWNVVHGGVDLSGVDPTLRPIVAAALAKDPRERPHPRTLRRLVSSRPEVATGTGTTFTAATAFVGRPVGAESATVADAHLDAPTVVSPQGPDRPRSRAVAIALGGLGVALGAALVSLALGVGPGRDEQRAAASSTSTTSSTTTTTTAPQNPVETFVDGVQREWSDLLCTVQGGLDHLPLDLDLGVEC